jgi:leucyl-tRNA synthetase
MEEIGKDHAEDAGDEFIKFTNKFIKKIGNNLENFSYNIIVANLHEMYSFLIKEISKGYRKTTILDNYKKILITMNPIIPHLSNECLKIIENKDKITWPSFDEKEIKEDYSLIVIQINGKKRGLITTDSNSSENEIMKLVYEDQKIAKYLVNNKIKKQIYIKNKLINIII